MTEFCNLTARNCKLFFKDKGVFFTSLITPLILLVLYATFLAKVYKNSFIAGIPQGIPISEKADKRRRQWAACKLAFWRLAALPWPFAAI
ncbi:MAG: hypothetical protein L6V88_10295 [Anaerotruncus sp.]|nr:MAG: hypothetical protein L6V88_10295 [Anaerotruncus sp.]